MKDVNAGTLPRLMGLPDCTSPIGIGLLANAQPRMASPLTWDVTTWCLCTVKEHDLESLRREALDYVV